MKPQNRRVTRSVPPDVHEVSPAAPSASSKRSAERSAPSAAAPTPSRALAALRKIAGVTLVALAAAGAAWGARKYVTTSPRFSVREIVVTGPRTKSAEEIARHANISVGDNVFLLDLDRAKRQLEGDPWIARATLARRLPGAVGIEIVERQAAIAVAAGDVWLASETGEVFKKLEPGDPSDLVVLTGLEAETLASDPEGAAKVIRRALDLAGDYQLSPLARRAPLQEIHVGTSGVTLTIGPSALELVLGQPPFRRKLDEAARVLAELEHRGASASALLLDNDARPDRVVARLR